MLIDSDVLVWLTRGHHAAAQRLAQIDSWQISVVTYIELAQGCRDKTELSRFKQGLAAANTQIIQLTPEISEHAARLIDTYAMSHGLRLADALIAATALSLDGQLLTANVKHFNAVPDLQIEAFLA
jgi:predicted nucleic acid-binding protein